MLALIKDGNFDISLRSCQEFRKKLLLNSSEIWHPRTRLQMQSRIRFLEQFGSDRMTRYESTVNGEGESPSMIAKPLQVRPNSQLFDEDATTAEETFSNSNGNVANERQFGQENATGHPLKIHTIVVRKRLKVDYRGDATLYVGSKADKIKSTVYLQSDAEQLGIQLEHATQNVHDFMRGRNEAYAIGYDLGGLECSRSLFKLSESIRREAVRLSFWNCGIKQLPFDFSVCSKLRYLDLRRNGLRQIHPNLTLIRSLEILDLSRNKIDELPESVESMTRLRVLSLDHNRIKSIPWQIGRMVTLEILQLAANPLSPLHQHAWLVSENSVVDHSQMRRSDLQRETLRTASLKKHLLTQSPMFLKALNTQLHSATEPSPPSHDLSTPGQSEGETVSSVAEEEIANTKTPVSSSLSSRQKTPLKQSPYHKSDQMVSDKSEIATLFGVLSIDSRGGLSIRSSATGATWDTDPSSVASSAYVNRFSTSSDCFRLLTSHCCSNNISEIQPECIHRLMEKIVRSNGISKLYTTEINLQRRDTSGNTLLHIAARFNASDAILHHLITQCSTDDLMTTNVYGQTFMHLLDLTFVHQGPGRFANLGCVMGYPHYLDDTLSLRDHDGKTFLHSLVHRFHRTALVNTDQLRDPCLLLFSGIPWLRLPSFLHVRDSSGLRLGASNRGADEARNIVCLPRLEAHPQGEKPSTFTSPARFVQGGIQIPLAPRPEEEDTLGRNVLHQFAAAFGGRDWYTVSYEHQDKPTPITAPQALDKLLGTGVDVNNYDNQGNTPLMIFIRALRPGKERTPFRTLIGALRPGKMSEWSEKEAGSCLRMLIASGADVRRRDRNRNSTLHLAVGSLAPFVIRILIEHGANVHARNAAGLSVMQMLGETLEAGKKREMGTQKWAKIMQCSAVLTDHGAVDEPTLEQEWESTSRQQEDDRPPQLQTISEEKEPGEQLGHHATPNDEHAGHA